MSNHLKASTVTRCVSLLTIILLTMGSLTTGLCEEAPSRIKEDPDYAVMDRYIQEQMEDCRIPGFSLGIVKGDQVLYTNGYGCADDAGRQVTPQTPFLVGSVSKTFTALAVVQLAEAGKVDLDAPATAYLPDFKLADARYSEITVRQLLNHTSGIAVDAEFQVATLRGDDETITELVQKFSKIKLKSSPGKRFEYGNANFIILGELIQKVSGLPYEEYIQKNIFDPLGMKHSYTSKELATQDGLAKGYRSIFGFPRVSNLPYRVDFLPAYSVISCAEDMTHYMIAMMNDGRYNGVSILSEQFIDQMKSPSFDISKYISYGLGWYVTSGSVYHGGELSDYQAKVKMLPEDGLGVVLLYNASSSTAVTLFNVGYRERIESGIINVMYGVSPTDQPGQSPLDLNSYPMALTYGLLFALVILAVLLLALSVWRMRSMPTRLSKSRFSFWRIVAFSLLLNVVLPLYILSTVPTAGVSWAFVLYYIPDMGWFALICSVLLFALGVTKGIIILKYLKNQQNKVSLKK